MDKSVHNSFIYEAFWNIKVSFLHVICSVLLVYHKLLIIKLYFNFLAGILEGLSLYMYHVALNSKYSLIILGPTDHTLNGTLYRSSSVGIHRMQIVVRTFVHSGQTFPRTLNFHLSGSALFLRTQNLLKFVLFGR